ncbi:MAG TPA: cysteine desulfurase [Corynebacteriales bacterium]|nr:cysteine desulfurase [Mycobacteriales bacterium]
MLCEAPEPIADLHYLDHAAISPLRPAAVEAMVGMAHDLGNPFSVHSVGRRARCHLEECREEIAELLHALPTEVIFVGSGTEANNIALQGTALARSQQRILISSIEHPSVTETAAHIAATSSRTVEKLPVSDTGMIHMDALQESLDTGQDPLVVAVHHANNEIGSIQPIQRIAELTAEKGIPFHIDAVQALGHIPVSFAHPGFTTMSFASQKFGGPTGIGILLARRGAPLVAPFKGGSQERELRPGTQNLLGVLGMTAALREAVDNQQAEEKRLAELRRKLISGIHAIVPQAVVNGPAETEQNDTRTVLPNIVSVSFPGCDGDGLVMFLDGKDISVSMGSACTEGVAEPSDILLATGMSEQQARSTIRLSMGYTTSEENIDAFLGVLPQVVERAHRASLD